MDIKDKNITNKIIFILFIAAVFLWISLNYETAISIIGYIIGLFMPLIIGACMAFVLNVIMKVFENHVFKFVTLRADEGRRIGRFWKRVVRPLCLILSLILVIGIITAIVALVIPELKNAVQLLIKEFPGYMKSVTEWASDTAAQFGIHNIEQYYPNLDWTSLFSNIAEFFSGNSNEIMGSAVKVTTGVFSVVTNIVLGFVFAIYILLQKEKLSKQAKGLLFAYLPKKDAQNVLDIGLLSHKIFGSFITGQFIEAIVIGALCYVGMTIIHYTIAPMPYALMISVLIGFTALIPVIGAFLGTSVGALLLLMESPLQAVIFVVWIIILQQIESNLIYPKVVGKSIGLPGIWVMLGVIVGGSVYGILGIIIGVPTCSVVYCLIRRYATIRLKNRNINIDEIEANDLREV